MPARDLPPTFAANFKTAFNALLERAFPVRAPMTPTPAAIPVAYRKQSLARSTVARRLLVSPTPLATKQE